MSFEVKRFETQRAKPVLLPTQQYVSLRELIEWVGKYHVDIPEDVEKRILAFGLQWEMSLAPQMRKRAMLFPPEPKLAFIYRQGMATTFLLHGLSEHRGQDLVWRNRLITGDAVPLHANDNRGWLALEQIVLEAQELFWGIINGEQAFNPAMSVRYPAAMGIPARKWFDALVFETNEIFEFLYHNLIILDGRFGLSPEEGAERKAVLQVSNKQPSKHPGDMDTKSLAKQIQNYPFIKRLLAEENQPSYLTSPDIAKCFAKCLNKPSKGWSKMLGDAPAWLKSARMSHPKKGITASWHPVMIACMLAAGVRAKTLDARQIDPKINLTVLSRIFEMNAELANWRHMWEREHGLLRYASD